jgi:cytochrome c556
MAAHYTQVDEIQEAVIAGDVDATRAPARWLSTHRGQEFPPAAEPALEMMRGEARILVQQRDILALARTLGRMGVACGTCHATLEAPVSFSVEEPPPHSPNPPAEMARHGWAMDRLWEGLVGPSDRSWNAGGGALTADPLAFGGNDQATRLEKRVHELADQARRAATPQARAETYGDLLETCALCHDALRLRSR